MDPGDVEYEPVSVKLVLAEMKDTSELIIDLAYSAVLHGSEELAEEVLELEAQMDILQMEKIVYVLNVFQIVTNVQLMIQINV